MGSRTVRLDADTEKVLQHIVRKTGLSVSDALKKGILVLRDEITHKPAKTPFDIYETLDLGPGGYARAPSTQTRLGVQQAIKRKLRR